MGLPSKLITKLYKVPKFEMAGCYLEAVVLIEHQILQKNLHGHASDKKWELVQTNLEFEWFNLVVRKINYINVRYAMVTDNVFMERKRKYVTTILLLDYQLLWKTFQ